MTKGDLQKNGNKGQEKDSIKSAQGKAGILPCARDSLGTQDPAFPFGNSVSITSYLRIFSKLWHIFVNLQLKMEDS